MNNEELQWKDTLFPIRWRESEHDARADDQFGIVKYTLEVLLTIDSTWNWWISGQAKYTRGMFTIAQGNAGSKEEAKNEAEQALKDYILERG